MFVSGDLFTPLSELYPERGHFETLTLNKKGFFYPNVFKRKLVILVCIFSFSFDDKWERTTGR